MAKSRKLRVALNLLGRPLIGENDDRRTSQALFQGASGSEDATHIR